MTLIYSDFHSLTSLQKIAEGEFELNKAPVSSLEELLYSIKVLWENVPALSSPSSVEDLTTLTACFSTLAEDIVWHLKVLGEDLSLHQEDHFHLEKELTFLYSQLSTLRDHLHSMIQQNTQDKISNVGTKLRLNLGAGAYKINGWINIDMFPADLSYNVLWGLPFKDESAEYIYSAYLLEHLNYKTEALNFLREIHRVLEVNGILRLCVPHIKPFMHAYLHSDHLFFAEVEKKWGFSFGETLLQKVLNYAGVGHKPGVVDDHKFAYDEETLEGLLKEAGFTNIHSCSYMQSQHSDLKVDLDPLSAEMYQSERLSLIYEVIK